MAPSDGGRLELEHAQRHRRSRRVVLLLATLAVLGLADLHLTVHHHMQMGMEELNPLGAYLLGGGHIGALVVFKLATMAVAIGMLLAVRAHPLGEASTWLAFGIMVALTLHWHQYNTELTHDFAGSYEQLSSHLRLAHADS